MTFYSVECSILVLTYVASVTSHSSAFITKLKFLNGLFLFVVCYTCLLLCCVTWTVSHCAASERSLLTTWVYLWKHLSYFLELPGCIIFPVLLNLLNISGRFQNPLVRAQLYDRIRHFAFEKELRNCAVVFFSFYRSRANWCSNEQRPLCSSL